MVKPANLEVEIYRTGNSRLIKPSQRKLTHSTLSFHPKARYISHLRATASLINPFHCAYRLNNNAIRDRVGRGCRQMQDGFMHPEIRLWLSQLQRSKILCRPDLDIVPCVSAIKYCSYGPEVTCRCKGRQILTQTPMLRAISRIELIMHRPLQSYHDESCCLQVHEAEKSTSGVNSIETISQSDLVAKSQGKRP